MRRASRPAGTATVVHLAAEYGDLARVGGLAEAVEGLARAQNGAGWGAAVVIPAYPSVRDAGELAPVGDWFSIRFGDHDEAARVSRVLAVGDVEVYAVESPRFDRPGVYGTDGVAFPDNDFRFGVLVRAALEALPRLAPRAVVLHAHDWHTALAPALAGALPGSIATVLSVHNAGHQGRYPLASFDAGGLPRSLTDALAPDVDGCYPWLEIGLRNADMVATVSAAHAVELRTPLGGFGLHERFQALGDRLVGITNGIDPERWNPATDPALGAPFDAGSLDGRAECRRALLSEYGFSDADSGPVVGMVARLVEQKGLDLLLSGVVDRFPKARFVVLGRGEPRYERQLAELAAALPERVRVPLDFNPAAERRLLAGADLLVIPSLFEPCGLVQMHAQRYGAIPVARRVGGLAETIDDARTGFLFDAYSVDGLAEALGRAVAALAEPKRREAMIQAAMARDFSWSRVVAGYQALYQAALKRRGLAEPWSKPLAETRGPARTRRSRRSRGLAVLAEAG